MNPGSSSSPAYEPELGLDFKKVPYFFEYLTRIRNSEGFFPDRIVQEQKGEGKLRKFAYMPTPDHRYILELGFAKSSFPSRDINCPVQKGY